MINQKHKLSILFINPETAGKNERPRSKTDRLVASAVRIATLLVLTLNLGGSVSNIATVIDSAKNPSSNTPNELANKPITKLPIETFTNLENRLSQLDPKAANANLIIKRVLTSVQDMDPVGVANFLATNPSKELTIKFLSDLRTDTFGVKTAYDLGEDFQNLGEGLKKGLLKIPGNIATHIFSTRVNFDPNTAPKVDIQGRWIPQGTDPMLDKYTELRFSGNVNTLKAEGVLVTLQDGSTAINVDMLKRKIYERDAGANFVKALKSITIEEPKKISGVEDGYTGRVSLWDVIRNENAGNDTLAVLGTYVSEEDNRLYKENTGFSREYLKDSPIPNVSVLSVVGEENYLVMDNYKKSLADQFKKTSFLLPLQELRDLSEKAGVKFELRYKPESFGMEGASAKNFKPKVDPKTGELYVQITDTMRYNDQYINTTRENEDAEGMLSLKLSFEAIIEARQNNPDILPGTPEFSQLINDVLATNPSEMVGSASFQLFTIVRDWVSGENAQVSEYFMAILRDKNTQGEQILSSFPEIKLGARTGQVKNFESMSPDQQADIWKWAKADPNYKSSDPQEIAKMVDQYIRHQGKRDEIMSDVGKWTDSETMQKILNGEITRFVQLPGSSQSAFLREMMYKDPEYTAYYVKTLNERSAQMFKDVNDPTNGLYLSYNEKAIGRPEMNWEDPEKAQKFLDAVNMIATTDGRPIVYFQNPDWYQGSSLPPFLARAKTPKELKNQPFAWHANDALQISKNILLDTRRAINKFLQPDQSIKS